MNLQTVKRANPEFFSESIGDYFGDSEMEIITDATDGAMLRMTSALGTRPVYKIDPTTQKLSYHRHDADEVLEECPD